MCLGEKNEERDKKTVDRNPILLPGKAVPLFLTVIMTYAFLILATCLLFILIFSKRGLKFLGHARLVCTKITLEVVSCGITKINILEGVVYC